MKWCGDESDYERERAVSYTHLDVYKRQDRNAEKCDSGEYMYIYQKEIRTLIAVSYTHLDVYKRQILHISTFIYKTALVVILT